MLRTPPDILITTPESLYLLLTSRAREMLTGIEAVIVDEVHAVAATKRGAHLALSLERLADLCERDPQRVALSATQRPLEEIARFVGGDRQMHIVDAGMRKELDLRIEMPAEPEAEAEPAAPLAYVQGANDGGSHSLWPALYPELLELVRSHHSTIVFVNSRRMAERLALRLNELAEEDVARAHHGSLSREARGEVEEALKAGTLPCIVATSSLELGIDMGAVDLVVQVSSPGSVASGLQRVGRAGHSRRRALARAHLPALPRRARRGRGRRPRHARGRGRAHARAAHPARRPVPADRRDGLGRGAADRRAARARPARLSLPRAHARAARERARPARRPLPVGRVRRAAAAHRLGAHDRRRCAHARAPSASPSRTRARSPTAGSTASSSSTAAGASASSTRRWCTRRARARSSCSARRPGASSRSSATA